MSTVILGGLATHLYAPVQDMAKIYEVEYVEVSAKTGEGVEKMFESLPPKIEAVRNKFASEAAAREDYTTNIISTAKNRPEKECCNIC